MKVAVRLILLAGVAALLALMVREPLAVRLALAFAEPTRDLAAWAPKPKTIVPLLPRATSAVPTILPMLPMLPMLSSVQAGPVTVLPIPKHIVKKPEPAKANLVNLVTRKEVEEAIASRLSGVSAVLVHDDAGKPLGLRLAHVGRLAPFGVQEGDLLVAANGLPLRTADEAASALGALKDATRVTFTLRRGDKSYGVPLQLAD